MRLEITVFLLVVVSSSCTELDGYRRECNEEEMGTEAVRCVLGVENRHTPNQRYVQQCGIYMAYQCDGQTLRLECPSGERVVILYTFYGRLDDTVCPFDRAAGVAATGSCYESETNARIKQLLDSRCRNRNSNLCADLVVGQDFVGRNIAKLKNCWLSRADASDYRNRTNCAFALLVRYTCLPQSVAISAFATTNTSTTSATVATTRTTTTTFTSTTTTTTAAATATITSNAVSTAATDETSSSTTDRGYSETTTAQEEIQTGYPESKPVLEVEEDTVEECPGIQRDGIEWPATKAGSGAYRPCPEIGTASWFCLANGRWSDGPDVTDCRSRVVEQLVANNTDRLSLMRGVSSVTAESSLQAGDLPLVIDAIKSASVSSSAKPMPATRLELDGLVQATSDLFDEKQQVAWRNQPNRSELVYQMIDSVESVAYAYAYTQSQSQSSGNDSDSDSTLQANVVAPAVELQLHVVSLRSEASLPSNGSKETVVPAADAASGSVIVESVAPDASEQNSSASKTPFAARLNISAYVAKYFPESEVNQIAVVFARFGNVAEYVAETAQVVTDQVTDGNKPSPIRSARLITDVFVTSVHRLDVPDNSSKVPSSPRNYDSSDRHPVVQFSLRHVKSNSTVPSDKRVCAFWYTDGLSSGDGVSNGYWSDVGCWRLPDDGPDASEWTRCACSHLTSFAVLLDTSGILRSEALSDVNELLLTLLTLIGCGLSCLSALLAFMLFSITNVYKGRFPERNTIHKNVCINLCIAQLSLLVNLIAHDAFDAVGCTTLGVIQHFFFLVTFSWISLEGVQLFIMLVIVFETKHSLKLLFYAIGYGVPSLIVAVSVSIRPSGYVNNKMCWLTTENGFIWAFAGPIALVLAINYTVFTVAWVTIANHSARRAHRSDSHRPCVADEQDAAARGASSSSSRAAVSSASSTSQQTSAALRSWLKGASVLCVLLGLTWVFGFFLWITPTVSIVFAYIFTVLNSVQGTFILLLHFLIDAKVRSEAWNKVQRLRVIRQMVNAASRSHRSSSLRPAQQPCVVVKQPLRSRSSSSRLSFWKRQPSSSQSSAQPSSFNTLLSLFGRRIALQRNRKPARATNSDMDVGITEAAKEKLLGAGVSVIADSRRNNVKGDQQQLNVAFSKRYLAEQEEFSVLSDSEPLSSASNSNTNVPSSQSSSSVAPFSRQCPPSYANATERSSRTPHCSGTTQCKCATQSLADSDSAYGTQPEKTSKDDSDFDSRIDSEALSSYCDSRILTEFNERVVADEDALVMRRRHNHKCSCDHSVEDSDLCGVEIGSGSDQSVDKQRSNDTNEKHLKRFSNNEKIPQSSRLSELLTAVAEKDFESELTDSDLFG